MKKSSAKLNPFLRFAAAGTLLIWLSAMVMCRAHCCGDDSHADAQVALHNGAKNSHDAGQNNHHEDDPACLTLKSALHNGDAITLVKPDVHFVYSLGSVARLADAIAIPHPTYFRQHKKSDGAFTLEVCLGPALHSLAPPSPV